MRVVDARREVVGGQVLARAREQLDDEAPRRRDASTFVTQRRKRTHFYVTHASSLLCSRTRRANARCSHLTRTLDLGNLACVECQCRHAISSDPSVRLRNTNGVPRRLRRRTWNRTNRRQFLKRSSAVAAAAGVAAAVPATAAKALTSSRRAATHRRNCPTTRRSTFRSSRTYATSARDSSSLYTGEQARSPSRTVASPPRSTTRRTEHERGLTCQPPRGAGDLEGSGRRQHRPLRVREPGRARHRHAHRQLRAAPGAGGRAELLRVRRRRPATRSTSTTTTTARSTSRTSSGSRPWSRSAGRSSTTSGPITSLDSSNWNRRQFYSVTRIDWEPSRRRGSHGRAPRVRDDRSSRRTSRARRATSVRGRRRTTRRSPTRRSRHFPTAPRCSPASAPRASTSTSDRSSTSARCGRSRARTCIPMPGSAAAVNATKDLNVHSIALQIPMTLLTSDGEPADRPQAAARRSSACGRPRSRQRVHFNHGSEDRHNDSQLRSVDAGVAARQPVVQRSARADGAQGRLEPRLAVRRQPVRRRRAAARAREVAAGALPGAFPNLQALVASGKPRADLAAILLTGIPAGVVSPNFQNFTGTTQADLLRLNMAIPPSAAPNNLGVVGGDLAGFPNGRRVADDVVTIELKAIAGATYPLVDPTFTPDAAVGIVDQGLTSERHGPDRPRAPRLPDDVPVPRSPAQRLRGARGMSHDHGHHDDDHGHDHDHGDGHESARSEPRLAPSGQGTVVLDIGDGVGALVVHTTSALDGVEIEIARAGRGARRSCTRRCANACSPTGPVLRGRVSRRSRGRLHAARDRAPRAARRHDPFGPGHRGRPLALTPTTWCLGAPDAGTPRTIPSPRR